MPSVNVLQSVSQHGAVDLHEDVGSEFDDEVRADTQDSSVVCGMVDLAHCEPIRNDGLPAFRIAQNVRGIEKIDMFEPAD